MTFHSHDINVKNIVSALENPKVNTKLYGPDKIPANVLKLSADVVLSLNGPANSQYHQQIFVPIKVLKSCQDLTHC